MTLVKMETSTGLDDCLCLLFIDGTSQLYDIETDELILKYKLSNIIYITSTDERGFIALDNNGNTHAFTHSESYEDIEDKKVTYTKFLSNDFPHKIIDVAIGGSHQQCLNPDYDALYDYFILFVDSIGDVYIYHDFPLYGRSIIPTKITELKDIVKVTTGFDLFYACDINGYLWSCGENEMGLLGFEISTEVIHYPPMKIPQLANIINIYIDMRNYSVFINDKGDMYLVDGDMYMGDYLGISREYSIDNIVNKFPDIININQFSGIEDKMYILDKNGLLSKICLRKSDTVMKDDSFQLSSVYLKPIANLYLI